MSKPALKGDDGGDADIIIPPYNRPETKEEADTLASILGPRLRGEEPKKKKVKAEPKEEDKEEENPTLYEKQKEANKEEVKKDEKEVKKEEEEKDEDEVLDEEDAISIDDITDANIEEIDVKNIVNRRGKPISAPVAKVIKDYKVRLSKDKETITQLTEKLKLAETNSSGIKKEDYDKVVSERDEFKKYKDDIEFEESEEFKQTYVTPVEEAADALDIYIKMIPKEALNDLKKMIPDMETCLHSGNQDMYMQTVDRVMELFKSQAAGSAFGTCAINLWNAESKRNKATKDKAKVREELKKGFVASKSKTIESLRKILPEKVKSLVPSDIDAFIEGIRKDDKLKGSFDLDSFSADKVAQIAATLNNPSEEVIELLAAGNYHKTIGKNRDIFLRKALDGANAKLSKAEQELERLKKKLKAANGGDPSDSILKGRKNGYDRDDDDDDDGEETMGSVARRVFARIDKGSLKD